MGASAQSEIQTAATIPIDPTAIEALIRKLHPGEQLLWAGRPHAVSQAALFAVWAIFSICLFLSGHPAGHTFQWNAHLQILPFVLGIGFVAIRLLARRRTFYGVTDRRALTVSPGCTSSVRLLDDLGIPVKISRGPFGQLHFSATAVNEFDVPVSKRSQFGFSLGPNVDAIHEIAASAQRKILDDADQASIIAASAKPVAR